MSYEQKPGQGSLFKNGYKKAENHPDYKGTANIDGEAFDLAAWLKKSAKGETYMSLSIKPKRETTQERASQKAAQAEDPDDSIPF